ncbi:MAG: hypothetical protein AAF546_00495 [Verrucomicrobiota bacterium]
MNSVKPRIWVSNDPCCGAFLKEGSILFNSDTPRIVVEVTEYPSLAPFFGLETPIGFPGVSGILAEGISLESLSILPPDGAFPIVFASGQPKSLSAIGSALRKIQAKTEEGVQVEIIIETESIQALLPWLHGFGGIGILYSLDHAPNKNYERFVDSICEEDYLQHETWNGLYAYLASGTAGKEIDESVTGRLKEVPNSVLLDYPQPRS